MFEILLSALAILISVLSFAQASKHNTMNLKSRFYEKIFDEYLTEKIPKAMRKIHYDNNTNRLSDADDIRQVLSDLKKDCLFFKYSNQKFYKSLTKLINELEQEISNKLNNPESDNQVQSENILKIGDKVGKIYKCILNHSVK